MRAVFIWFLFCTPVLGTAPKAVVTGPKEARPGSLVVLDASESQGLGRLWVLASAPEETSFLPVDGGLKCIFASPTSGKYVFILVVSGTNVNGGPAVDMVQHVVTLFAANPPPAPPVVVQPPPVVPPVVVAPPVKVDRVTYLYEKDKTNVPRPVAEALNTLNGQGIVATEFEIDTTDGTGEVPAQYSKSVSAARAAGLPCLVAEAGGKIVRVVANPTTLEMVMEVVR